LVVVLLARDDGHDRCFQALVELLLSNRAPTTLFLLNQNVDPRDVHPQLPLANVDETAAAGNSMDQSAIDRTVEWVKSRLDRSNPIKEEDETSPMFIRSPDRQLAIVADRHVAQLNPIFYSSNDVHDTYFTDNSFLYEDYTAILRPELTQWQLFSANENTRHAPSGKQAIKRILPIIRQTYSADQIEVIKFCVHFQLCLGMELVVVFTDDRNLLIDSTGTDNLVIVRHHMTVGCSHFYWDDNEGLTVQAGTSHVEELYEFCRDHHESADSIKLRYNLDVLSDENLDLTARYGALLYELQDRKCAVTGVSLDHHPWRVERILEKEDGGNNSLVNVAAVSSDRNIRRKLVEKFSKPSALAITKPVRDRYGLDLVLHQQLAHRGLRDHPIGPNALLTKSSVFAEAVREFEEQR